MSTGHAALWGIILAGGEGERLQGFIQEQCGSAIPKQFCAFVGRRSLLERTIRRARLLIPPERLVVSGTAHHNPYIVRNLGAPPPCTVLLQPANRDTAPGILLPLVHILQKDPHALVAILPADHFILPSHRFMRAVAAAARFVADMADIKGGGPVILAVKPHRPDSEYGWIEPGKFAEHSGPPTIRQIEKFVEKPSRDRAEQLMKDGWLWNTMVIVVRATTLMDLVRKRLPHLAAWFTVFQRIVGDAREQDFIEEMYQSIPKINFSASVLAGREMRPLVLPVQDIYWSDWETKDHILDTATAFGLSLSVPIRASHNSATMSA